MITLSETARPELGAYFTDKERSPIRVFLAPGGCQGPRLALALDGPTDDDQVFEDAGFTLCVEKDLFAETGNISVDMNAMGFSVSSDNPVGGGEGGCASCGGGCGG